MTNSFPYRSVRCLYELALRSGSQPRQWGRMNPGIRAVIADADPSARRQLRLLLAVEPGVEVVEECASAAQTAAAVRTHQPDLLLLDIGMRDGSSVSTMDPLAQVARTIVVFTSVSAVQAIQAFESSALDYLVKPFDPRRVHAALDRTRAVLLKAEEDRRTHRLLDLLAAKKTLPPVDRRLVVKASGRVVLLQMEEIDWIRAARNYVEIRVGTASFLMRERISRLLPELDPDIFLRIHRSIIVNVRRIRELQPCNRGEYVVVLRDGKQLSCSRGYRTQLRQLIAPSRNLA